MSTLYGGAEISLALVRTHIFQSMSCHAGRRRGDTQMIVFNQVQRLSGTMAHRQAHVEQPARHLPAGRPREHMRIPP